MNASSPSFISRIYQFMFSSVCLFTSLISPQIRPVLSSLRLSMLTILNLIQHFASLTSPSRGPLTQTTFFIIINSPACPSTALRFHEPISSHTPLPILNLCTPSWQTITLHPLYFLPLSFHVCKGKERMFIFFPRPQ